MSDPAGCKKCSHLIGYHWEGDEMRCTAFSCSCQGYEDPDEETESNFQRWSRKAEEREDK